MFIGQHDSLVPKLCVPLSLCCVNDKEKERWLYKEGDVVCSPASASNCLCGLERM